MNRFNAPDNVWDGFFCKLQTVDDEGKQVRNWQVFDNGRFLFNAPTKGKAEVMYLEWKLGRGKYESNI